MSEYLSDLWCAIVIAWRWYIVDAFLSLPGAVVRPREFIKERGAIAGYWSAWMVMTGRVKSPTPPAEKGGAE